MTKLITSAFAAFFALSSYVAFATTHNTVGGAAGAAANATNNEQAMIGSKVDTTNMGNDAKDAAQNQAGQATPAKPTGHQAPIKQMPAQQ